MNQLCLVSRQSMPNIIPAILYKPEKVILLTTKEEKTTADNIKTVLIKSNIQCDIYYEYVSAYDLNSVKEVISKLLNSKEDFTLNITGGTKLMAIAAYEIFRNKNMNILYCDTFDENIIQFKNGEIKLEKYENIKINVDDYLSSYGYKRDPNHAESVKFSNKELLNFIKDNFKEFVNFSSLIRKEIPDKENQFDRSIEDFQFERRNSKMFLHYKNIEIFSSDYKNLNYLIGNWLEDYIYDYIKLRFPNSDVKKSYNILSSSDSPNEIDLLFTRNGKLFLISCKTGKFDKKDLFELEGLRNLAGGTFSKAYKITISKDDSFEKMKQRAKEMNIKLLTVIDFKNEMF